MEEPTVTAALSQYRMVFPTHPQGTAVPWPSLPGLEILVLAALRRAGDRGLTPKEAEQSIHLSGASLTRRISKLRASGYRIASLRKRDPNGIQYTRYFLNSHQNMEPGSSWVSLMQVSKDLLAERLGLKEKA